MLSYFRKVLSAILLLSLSVTATASDVAVPIGNSTSTPLTMTSDEIRMIFTMRITRWENGTRIRLVMLPVTSSEHKEFLWEVLGILPSRHKRSIEKKIYNGKSLPPIPVDSFDEMIKVVGKTTGALGYINGALIIMEDDHVRFIQITD